MKLSQLLLALPRYQILSETGRATILPEPAVTISNITADSRQVKAGSLFVAYRGVSQDGHQFIPEALNQGAAAIMCETIPDRRSTETELPGRPFIQVPNGREALAYVAAAWYHFPARHIATVGITGTDGKTTTTNYLYQILRAGNRKAGMINTVNAIIGDRVLETGLHTTTPDAPDVQRYLAEMVESGAEISILETTSHGLAQHRVTACEFDVAIATNITHEHLDIHGSLAAYRAAKASLFDSLAMAKAKGLSKTAILNCDDWSFDFLKKKLAPARPVWLGYTILDHPEASISAQRIVTHPDKTTFTIRGSGYSFEAETSLLGDYNISNCLAAVTAAIEVFGVKPQAVQRGIAALPGIPGRMERIDEKQPFLAIVDFAHTPNALRRSLTTARDLTSGRVIAVFGSAGQRDVAKRAIMGEVAAGLANLTIITAEDPRTEDPDSIIAETARAMMAVGAVEGESFERIPDRGKAIYRAVQLARPGDIVLALGKGHEQSMCFGTVEYPWDDRDAMRAALRGAPLLTLPTAFAP